MAVATDQDSRKGKKEKQQAKGRATSPDPHRKITGGKTKLWLRTEEETDKHSGRLWLVSVSTKKGIEKSGEKATRVTVQTIRREHCGGQEILEEAGVFCLSLPREEGLMTKAGVRYAR